MNYTKAVKQKSLELGFDLTGITSASKIPPSHAQYLRDWLKSGFHADMGYMSRNIEKRLNPAVLLENAISVVCVGLVYKPQTPDNDENAGFAGISDYALYDDYHGFIKERLFALADYISEISHSQNIRTKICVDSTPVAERSLAQRAGLGFIGKNHMLINPEMGVEIFLGELITDLQLEPDEPMENACSDCCKCIRACPTGALSADGSFDANRCISYLTIEHKGDFPDGTAAKIGNSLFGCDRCVRACPYHFCGQTRKNQDMKFCVNRRYLDPAEILNWDQEMFDKIFANSPVERLGLAALKRNANACIKP
jgi:epoxyqueuosine reductase